jgi:hypothetical protein
MCRSKHFEQLRNIGIINSTTWSHLFGYFYKILMELLIIFSEMNDIKFEVTDFAP